MSDNPGDSAADRLNDNQRRRLAVRFARLLEEAGNVRELLAESDVRELDEEVAGLVACVEETVQHLGLDLESSRLDTRRQVEFWAAMWWTRVLDLGPSRLKGSGPVEPEVADYLGPAVDRMAQQLTRIRRVAKSGSPARS